jgi:hypothetical protein
MITRMIRRTRTILVRARSAGRTLPPTDLTDPRIREILDQYETMRARARREMGLDR